MRDSNRTAGHEALPLVSATSYTRPAGARVPLRPARLRMNRSNFVVFTLGALLVAGAVGAYVWSSRPAHSEGAPGTGAPARPERVTRQVGAGDAARPPPPAQATPADPAAFDIMPTAHGSEAVQAALAGMADWAETQYPEARAVFQGVDCADPPCMIGLRFELAGFDDPKRGGEFLDAYKAEVVRRTGFPMTTVTIEDDRDGRQNIWMYGIPEEWPADDALREVLIEEATERHGARMAPNALPLEPATPQSGEPGSVPE